MLGRCVRFVLVLLYLGVASEVARAQHVLDFGHAATRRRPATNISMLTVSELNAEMATCTDSATLARAAIVPAGVVSDTVTHGATQYVRWSRPGCNFAADTVGPPIELKPLTFSADVVTRVEDIANGNVIAPALNANWAGRMAGRETGRRLDGAFRLSLQSPITTGDSQQTVTRLRASGGVGELNGTVKASAIHSGNNPGFQLGAGVGLSWENSMTLDGGVGIPSFVFVNGHTFLAGWLGPMYFGIQHTWNSVLGKSDTYVQQNLGSPTTGLLAARLGDYYLQLKLLVPKKNEDWTKENFEVRLITQFTPF